MMQLLNHLQQLEERIRLKTPLKSPQKLQWSNLDAIINTWRLVLLRANIFFKK